MKTPTTREEMFEEIYEIWQCPNHADDIKELQTPQAPEDGWFSTFGILADASRVMLGKNHSLEDANAHHAWLENKLWNQ